MELQGYFQHMKQFLSHTVIERAQPWLGTFVSIRVEDAADSPAHRAINAAFAEIGLVHRLMSFHNSDSDVTKLNRYAFHGPVKVHPYSLKVIKHALEISSVSGGCFDITIGAELVNWKVLPRLTESSFDPKASWQDIELLTKCRVVFHRSLLIDLGGIAKGYAVDRAAKILDTIGIKKYIINAGGDIRVNSEYPETIALDAGFPMRELPFVEIKNGSIASSTGWKSKKLVGDIFIGPHVNGIFRSPVPPENFASVTAKSCTIADALTKVVLAQGVESKRILKLYGAGAYFYNAKSGWINLRK